MKKILEDLNITCPNCGCNPKQEPYCMEFTHCPKCGFILPKNQDDIIKLKLIDNMCEYLYNYGIAPNVLGITDDTKIDDAYQICFNYIIELIGRDADFNFFKNILGFTKADYQACLKK